MHRIDRISNDTFQQWHIALLNNTCIHYYDIVKSVEFFSFLFIIQYSYLLERVQLNVPFLWDRQTKFLVCQPSFYYLNCCFRPNFDWDSILVQKFRLFCILFLFSVFDWGSSSSSSNWSRVISIMHSIYQSLNVFDCVFNFTMNGVCCCDD